MTSVQLTALAALAAKHRIWLKGSHGLTVEEIDAVIAELSEMARVRGPSEPRKTVPFTAEQRTGVPGGVPGTLDRLMHPRESRSE